LDKHIQSLFEEEQPELIFAESVGSCTDLVSTIAKPFTQFRPNYDVVIAVFADASLLLQLLEGKLSFIKESIRYIFKKQLEEADLLVLNKADLITSEQRAFIDSIIYNDYPDKIILHQNYLLEKDIKSWLETILQFKTTSTRKSLNIDYDLYGEGEAQLAWLDKKISIHSYHHNAIQIAERIAREIHDTILQQQLVVGHLKYFMESDKWKKKLSATMIGNDFNSVTADEHSYYCSVLINARVQTEPSLLHELVDRVIQKTMKAFSCKITIEKSSSFIPGYPRPTHRFVE
jgi:G3E family GTPase